MIPAAPTRILAVRAPTCAVSSSGAEQARLRMLWCSETQYRRYPAASTVWAMPTAPATDALAVSPYSIPTKSSTASGSDCSVSTPVATRRARRSIPDSAMHTVDRFRTHMDAGGMAHDDRRLGNVTNPAIGSDDHRARQRRRPTRSAASGGLAGSYRRCQGQGHHSRDLLQLTWGRPWFERQLECRVG